MLLVEVKEEVLEKVIELLHYLVVPYAFVVTSGVQSVAVVHQDGLDAVVLTFHPVLVGGVAYAFLEAHACL